MKSFLQREDSPDPHPFRLRPPEIAPNLHWELENELKSWIALPHALASAARRHRFWLGCLAVATWLGYGVWAFYPEGRAGALTGPRVARFLQSPPAVTPQDEIPDAQLPAEIDGFLFNIMASANGAARRSQGSWK